MSEDAFNWSVVDLAVNPQRKRYEFEPNKELFRKVAFDTYKTIDGKSSQLWELRDEDGKSFLYALYDEAEDIVANSEKEDKKWEAVANAAGDNVTLSYQNVPIYRFASTAYPYQPQDATRFAQYIQASAQSPDWVKNFLDNAVGISNEKRAAIRRLTQGD